jgi:integrase
VAITFCRQAADQRTRQIVGPVAANVDRWKRRVKGLYQRPDSGVFWASYQDASGRRVRESLKTNDRDTAERLLLEALLPEELRAAMRVAFTFGWRKREVLDLRRRQLDLEAGTLRLDPGETKNGEGQVVYLTAELKVVLAEQVRTVEVLQRQRGRIIPWLFPHLSGIHTGDRVVDPRKAWKTACKRAGVPGTLVHDMRQADPET